MPTSVAPASSPVTVALFSTVAGASLSYPMRVSPSAAEGGEQGRHFAGFELVQGGVGWGHGAVTS